MLEADVFPNSEDVFDLFPKLDDVVSEFPVVPLLLRQEESLLEAAIPRSEGPSPRPALNLSKET